MSNWKTTIGGALSALGSSVAALSTYAAFTEPQYKKIAIVLIVAGGLLSAFGKFFGMLFAKDVNSAADDKAAKAEQAIKQIPQQ